MVGYLGDCVGFYFASLVVWTLLKGKRPRHARLWMRFIAKCKRFKEEAGGSLSVPVFVEFLLFAVVIYSAAH